MSDSPMHRELADHLLSEAKSGRMSRRQLIVRATVLGLSATAVGRILAACGGNDEPTAASASATAAPKAGGTLKVGMVSPIVALDPTTMYDTGSIALTQQVAEYLIWVNNDLTLRPVLAEKWEPDATAKNWTFTLRQGVTFQHGKPFGADDVLATMDILLNPDTVSAALSSFQGILSQGGVEKVDDSTVIFHLDQAFADFPYLVASTNYDCLILPSDYKPGTWQKNPVGTGPVHADRLQARSRAPRSRRTPRTGSRASHTSTACGDVQRGDPVAGPRPAVGHDRHDAGHPGAGLAGAVHGSQPHRAHDALDHASQDAHAGRHEAVHRQERAPGACVDAGPPGHRGGLFKGKAQVADDNVFFSLYPLAPRTSRRATRTSRRPRSC